MQRRTGSGASSYADSVKDQAAAQLTAASSRRPNNSYVNLLSTPPRNRAANLREGVLSGGAADDRRGSIERLDDRRGSMERPDATTNRPPPGSYYTLSATSGPAAAALGDDKGLARLFTNLKLLKDSLRQTSAVGAQEFDSEVAAEAFQNAHPSAGDGLPSSSNGGADMEISAIREATWMVRARKSKEKVSRHVKGVHD